MGISICPECGGEGCHEVPHPQLDDPFFCVVEQCRNCGGVGYVEEDDPQAIVTLNDIEHIEFEMAEAGAL